MKIVLVISTLIVLSTALKSAKYVKVIENLNSKNLRNGTFVTKLDHFSPQDSRTATFHYAANLDYYQNNGPFFVYINDGEIFTTEFLETGLMHDIAKEVNAALFTTDHRYFRQNRPTANTSFSNLEYLTVEQSVADIAVFITAIKEQLEAPDARVILWGTAHGAVLATWARQSYPHLVDAVWSSSGIYERTDHTSETFEHLSRNIREVGGEKCANNILNAFEVTEYLLRTYELEEIESAFHLCDWVLPYDEDIAIFFETLIRFINNYINVYHYHGIINLCEDLETSDLNEFLAFSAWIKHVFGGDQCMDISYFSIVPPLWDEKWENPASASGTRQQVYFTCTQLAHYSTTVNGDTLFGRTIALDYYLNFCSDVLGTGYDFMKSLEAVKALNLHYGGRNPGITNVIFTNGLLDINLAFGITEYNNVDSHVINIPSHARSADLFSIGANDAPALKIAKEEIRSIITRWSTNE